VFLHASYNFAHPQFGAEALPGKWVLAMPAPGSIPIQPLIKQFWTTSFHTLVRNFPDLADAVAQIGLERINNLDQDVTWVVVVASPAMWT
jgi:hypothetical protein